VEGIHRHLERKDKKNNGLKTGSWGDIINNHR